MFINCTFGLRTKNYNMGKITKKIVWTLRGAVFENKKNQNIADSLIVVNEQNENQVLVGQ